MTEDGIELAIETVMHEQYDSHQRNVLAIWTIYKCPKDWPQGYIARKHEVVGGSSTPTDRVIQTESHNDDLLEVIRHIFRSVGLTQFARSPGDDEHIVESWL
jgi:hypothetical protein